MDSALQLNRMGIRRGDRLAVVLPNGPERATAFLAVSSVCTCAPLNPAYSIDEMTFSMQDLHVKALLTLPGGESPSRSAARALAIPVIDLEPDERVAGLFRFASDLPDDGHVTEPSFSGLEDVALVLHTPGTKQASTNIRTLERQEHTGHFKEIARQLVNIYQPEPYDGKVVLFAAEDQPWYVRWDPMETWPEFLTGPLQIIRTPGDHVSFLRSPHAVLLAEKILAALPDDGIN